MRVLSRACSGAEPVPQLAHPAAGLRALAAFSAQQCSSGAKESLQLLFMAFTRAQLQAAGGQPASYAARCGRECVCVFVCVETDRAKGQREAACGVLPAWCVGWPGSLWAAEGVSADTDATDCHVVFCFRATMPWGDCVSGADGCNGHVETQGAWCAVVCSVCTGMHGSLGLRPCCCDSQPVCLCLDGPGLAAEMLRGTQAGLECVCQSLVACAADGQSSVVWLVCRAAFGLSTASPPTVAASCWV